MERLGRGCQPVPSMQWNHRVHFLKVKPLIVALPQHPPSPSIILRPFGSCCYGDHKQNGMQINTSNNSGKGQGEPSWGWWGRARETLPPAPIWAGGRKARGESRHRSRSLQSKLQREKDSEATKMSRRWPMGQAKCNEGLVPPPAPLTQPQALTGQTEGEPALGEGACTRRGPPGRETPGLLPLWDEPGRSAL